VSCKARLGSRDIRYGVAAEPEGILSTGVAGRLSVRGAKIPGHCGGQHSEHHDCCEPNTSGWNISHLTQSSHSDVIPSLLPSLVPSPSGEVRMRQRKCGALDRLYCRKPRLSLTGQSTRKAVALSNAIAARPFHAFRFCPCGRLADRLGCRRTRRRFAAGHAVRSLS
jgi:hypothetical protein